MFLWRSQIAGNNETYFDLHVKCPIWTKFAISRQFHNSHLVSNFTQIRPKGATLVSVGRRTDMTKRARLIGKHSGHMEETHIYQAHDGLYY
jgi:hypothetical protein